MRSAEDIEAQAAQWIARCDHDAHGSDAGLLAWLAADPRHRAAYLRLAEAWRRSGRLQRLRPTDGLIDPDLLAPPRPPTGWRRLRRRDRASAESGHRRVPRALGWSAAAALAAAAWVLWWALAPPAPPAVGTQRTGPGDLYRAVLADGSSVILNADTDIRIRYTAERRSITLVRGEAQFLVRHDPRRPFDVHADGHLVRDVGTHFDVRINGRRSLVVLVTRGRVAVLPADGPGRSPPAIPPPTISAGELASVEAGQVTVRRLTAADISRRLAWKHRKLHFQGQTLGQAVAEFNRYNSSRLVIRSPSLASVRIGGNFDAIDTDSFVAALNRSFGILARHDGGRIYLFGPAAR